MDFVRFLIDVFLHLDKHLGEILQTYGTWTYGIMFVVIFLETGLVATPFLPGDSLLFAAGAFAALGALDVKLVLILLAAAAILGDTANYWIGRKVGPRVFKEDVRWLKKEYLERTHRFYEKHGGKTIVLARFIPIIRTFAPFVAGIGTMSYPRFLAYNVFGGCLWVVAFVLSGYFFGNLPVVKENFSFVILAIIVLSVLPLLYEVLRSARAGADGAGPDTAA
ncbi:MAG TPA: DedA family protein [Thermoanaerobaculales bacterium]|nr:DedA family protein [Thermoanaerobaculales bacterium]HPA81607.1 DedA family protein [Thermoanaerobaculales bacterium]HQN94971.1 DedA family protein [Thermoanaerobaculales bacterium]HQP42513.1 DedA family protein [Thermoanaerobaculales bacterium]